MGCGHPPAGGGKAPGSGPDIRGENVQWTFAREPTLENWFS